MALKPCKAINAKKKSCWDKTHITHDVSIDTSFIVVMHHRVWKSIITLFLFLNTWIYKPLGRSMMIIIIIMLKHCAFFKFKNNIMLIYSPRQFFNHFFTKTSETLDRQSILVKLCHAYQMRKLLHVLLVTLDIHTVQSVKHLTKNWKTTKNIIEQQQKKKQKRESIQICYHVPTCPVTSDW